MKNDDQTVIDDFRRNLTLSQQSETCAMELLASHHQQDLMPLYWAMPDERSADPRPYAAGPFA